MHEMDKYISFVHESSARTDMTRPILNVIRQSILISTC